MYYNSKNCGGLLQAFALQKVIEELGETAEQICYLPVHLTREQEQEIRKIALKKRAYLLMKLIQDPSCLRTKLMGNKRKKKTYGLDIKDKLKIQDDVFERFEQIIPHSTTVYDEITLKDANQNYDAFICGSDQVWHLSYLVHQGYFLKFVNANKLCVPYAVSTGKINMTPIEFDVFKNNLKRFSRIGVREQSFCDVIQDVHPRGVSVVLDPTLLLGKEKWEKIENKGSIPNEKYVFVYLLGDTKWHREKIQEFATRHNLKIVYLPYIMKCVREADMLMTGEARWNVGPKEFVALIHHAEYVFTDSFHAMAFSTIFEKEFYVFDRYKMSDNESMNFRIADFLKLFGMEWRRVSNPNDCIQLHKGDYSDVTNKLEKEREKSMNFLKTSLGL